MSAAAMSGDTAVLTNELVMMNREANKLKGELRQVQDQLKKSEKENYDLRKGIEGKENSLEKVRKERDELWAIVNTDKFKTLRQLEQEKAAIESERKDLKERCERLNSEQTQESSTVESLKSKLEQIEVENGHLKEKEQKREILISQLEFQKRELEQFKAENESEYRHFKE